MTRMITVEKTCAVCKKTSSHRIVVSSGPWQFCDLDFRPISLQRSLFYLVLQECPHCGYVAKNIEKCIGLPEDFFKSDEYVTCNGHEFKSEVSRKYYRHHLMAKAKNAYLTAFTDLKRCAWACDDKKDDELAVEIRKMALDCMDMMEREIWEGDEYLKVVRADMLRRSLQFDEVIMQFSGVSLEDSRYNQMMKCQIELAEKKDSDRYAARWNCRHRGPLIIF